MALFVKTMLLLLLILSNFKLLAYGNCNVFFSNNKPVMSHEISFSGIQRLRDFYLQSGPFSMNENFIPLDLHCIDKDIKELLFNVTDKGRARLTEIFKIKFETNGRWYIYNHDTPLSYSEEGEYSYHTTEIIKRYLDNNKRPVKLLREQDGYQTNLPVAIYAAISDRSIRKVDGLVKTHPCVIVGCNGIGGRVPPSVEMTAPDMLGFYAQNRVLFDSLSAKNYFDRNQKNAFDNLKNEYSKLNEVFVKSIEESRLWDKTMMDRATSDWSKIVKEHNPATATMQGGYIKYMPNSKSEYGFFIKPHDNSKAARSAVEHLYNNNSILYGTENNLWDLNKDFEGAKALESFMLK